MAARDQGVPQLDLRGHLPDVAVGSHGVHHVSVDLGRQSIGDRQVGGRPARIEDADAALARQRTQLGIVADERVQAAPDLELGALRSEEHTSELQSHSDLVCRLLLEKKKYESSTSA